MKLSAPAAGQGAVLLWERTSVSHQIVVNEGCLGAAFGPRGSMSQDLKAVSQDLEAVSQDLEAVS
jgi:hypothetical protein